MNIIFDASSLLNLDNGGALETVLSIPNLTGRLGPQVLRECASISGRLNGLIADQRLALLTDEAIPASLFLSLLGRYQLGAGETECLAFASLGEDLVCCDDLHARRMITQELGRKRITGSLGLIARAVYHALIELGPAIAAYEQMRRCGGYLPELSSDELLRVVKSLEDDSR